jgi:hypothetical protein
MAIITSHTNDNQIIYNESPVTDQKVAIVTGASLALEGQPQSLLQKKELRLR